jgi:hypothetical protein
LFPQNRVNAFRFQSANDQIVGQIDQQGGLGGLNFATLVHTNVNSTASVATSAFGLLDGPASGLAGSSFPAAQSTGLGNPAAPPRGVTGLGAAVDQADYAAQCGPGGPMNQAFNSPPQGFAGNAALFRIASRVSGAAANPSVVITSPLPQQTFAPGDRLLVNVQVNPAVGATDVVIGMPPIPLTSTGRLDVSNFQGVQTLPANYAGPLTITPIALDAQQNSIEGVPLTINIAPATAPSQVAFAQRYFYLDPTAAPQQLELVGTFGGGIQIDLTSPVSGTTYASSNPAAVTVSPDGTASVVGTGVAVVTGSNRLATDFAVFNVESAASPQPPQNVGAAFTVQRGGFRLDRSTGFYVQSVVVTNSSQLPIPGSAYLVLTGLPAGISLVNKSGLTASALPGSPFVSLPLSADGRTLAPGQSTTLNLQFLNPNRANIAYTSSLYRSSTTP